MASRMIHLAVISDVIRRLGIDGAERLRFGAILPDAYRQEENAVSLARKNAREITHFKTEYCGHSKTTYGLTAFRRRYGRMMRRDGLYLGYYLHLVMDIEHRKYMFSRFDIDPRENNVEKVKRLHKDYELINGYLKDRYALSSDVGLSLSPDEKIFEIYPFDLPLMEEGLKGDFRKKGRGKCVYFTPERADELIEKCVEVCIKEIKALEDRRRPYDEYANAWYTVPESLLESTCNTRDLGGFRAGKGYTKYGRILRTDLPTELTPRDRELLINNGFTTVIDLRRETELEKKPGPFVNDPAFEYHNFTIYDGPVPGVVNKHLYEAYFREGTHRNIPKILKTVAESKNGVIFHCAAGKDRTGIVACYLLYICGVTRRDIIHDYMVTRETDKPIFDRLLAADPNRDMTKIIPTEENLTGMIRLIKRAYGSLDAYFDSVGVTENVRAKIRKKMIE